MHESTGTIGTRGALLGAGLAALLAGAGCGEESSAAECGDRGCVDLLNFSSVPAVIAVEAGAGITVPAATSQGGMLEPGTSFATVPSNVGSQTEFNLHEGGSAVRSVTCTVGPEAWLDINPALVVQTNRTLTCSGW